MSGFVTPPECWTVVHNPGAAAAATATKAAAPAGYKHVITGITVSTSAAGTAQTPIHAYLRDSTTGAGNILWSAVFAHIISDSKQISLTGLYIPGVAAQAVTLEFEAAGAAATVQSVALQGITVSA